MSRFSDLTSYKGVLPYSSELFGVYQPLLGWKSARTLRRYLRRYTLDSAQLLGSVVNKFQTNLQIHTDGEVINIGPLAPGAYAPSPGAAFNSTLVREIARSLPSTYSDLVWDQLTPDLVQRTLDGPVRAAAIDQYKTLWREQNNQVRGLPSQHPSQAVTTRLQQETAMAGMLLDFKSRGAVGDLKHIIYDAFQFKSLSDIFGLGTADNPFDTIDPHKDLNRVGLSPSASFISSASTSLNSIPSSAYP